MTEHFFDLGARIFKWRTCLFSFGKGDLQSLKKGTHLLRAGSKRRKAATAQLGLYFLCAKTAAF
ncbi:hypothetical protein D2M30_2880 [Bacillus amyloliquefaciens]|nr:hypothetical protein D2M30_2880 [Bacillus amyloliquefaciens]